MASNITSASREITAAPKGEAVCLACAEEMMAGDDHDADAHWDAGHLNCGPLVLELRGRLKAMPGHVLRVTALDTSAPEDIAAWCRVTGNELLRHDPASHTFWVKSRMNWS